MKGRDGERSGPSTIIACGLVCQWAVTERLNLRQMQVPTVYSLLCVPPLYDSSLERFVLVGKNSNHNLHLTTTNVHKRKDIVILQAIPRQGLIHIMWLTCLKVVWWDHYAEVLLCLTEQADHIELRMFVVIEHNSVQRGIRAFTFNTVTRWLTDHQ